MDNSKNLFPCTFNLSALDFFSLLTREGTSSLTLCLIYLCMQVWFCICVYISFVNLIRERVYIIMGRVLKGALVVTEFDCPAVSLFI